MMGFQGVMQTRGFKLEWGRADDNVTAANLLGSEYGGSNQFNRANIGLLVGHGVFGTTPDFTTSGSGPLETYFPIYKTGVNSYDWVRFTQFQFGGSGSSLRWMEILSCNNMFGDNYDDIYNKELLPIGDNLHLLLGSSSHSLSSVQFWPGVCIRADRGQWRATSIDSGRVVLRWNQDTGIADHQPEAKSCVPSGGMAQLFQR